jgi:hypothetical protein
VLAFRRGFVGEFIARRRKPAPAEAAQAPAQVELHA